MATASLIRARNGRTEVAGETKHVALVTRVSTDRQAMTEEGSLKNQLQRLRAHIAYKVDACGESWAEAAVYELRAVSGKDSMRSAEFQRLFADIRSGRVNVVLCTALDRICRSVKDFLHFFEFLHEYGVEFVCLKQNYDTTTPQGKLFVTIMMALAEFEREQTAERNRETTAARAERGLWNGGRLLGYDLDPARKGYLVPNEAEAAAVNFAVETYLECGSIAETAQAMNEHGLRTKAYSSRRGREHAPKEFTLTKIQYLLKNPAYIGRKAINEKGQIRLVPAVWPAIVDEEKFEAVQRLMAANARSNRNGAKPVRHVYVLSGLLHCGRCRRSMEGRSGTGRLSVRYYYYVCRNDDCRLRVAADEIERAVVERLRELGRDDRLVEGLVEATNTRLRREAPKLRSRRRALQRDLDDVRGQAERVMTDWAAVDEREGRAFLADKLAELAQRREGLQRAVAETDAKLVHVEGTRIGADVVRKALSRAGEVYEVLTPFERKELARTLLRQVEVGDRQIVLELYGEAYAETARAAEVRSPLRSEAPKWLPDEDSNLEPSG